jgi:hypothetical protein
LPPLSAAVYASAASLRFDAAPPYCCCSCHAIFDADTPLRHLRHADYFALMIFAIFASPPDAIFDAAAIFITLRVDYYCFCRTLRHFIAFIACFSMPLRWLSPAPLSPSAIALKIRLKMMPLRLYFRLPPPYFHCRHAAYFPR